MHGLISAHALTDYLTLCYFVACPVHLLSVALIHLVQQTHTHLSLVLQLFFSLALLFFLQYADPVANLLDKYNTFSTRLFRESCVFHRGNYVKVCVYVCVCVCVVCVCVHVCDIPNHLPQSMCMCVTYLITYLNRCGVYVYVCVLMCMDIHAPYCYMYTCM